MQWFDRWFYRKVRWAWGRAHCEHPNWKQQEDYLDRMAEWGSGAQDAYLIANEPVRSRLGGDPHNLSDGMRIDIKKINGGYVVTVCQPSEYDRPGLIHERDEAAGRTSYMIGDDEDFDQSLCRILGMERLKR